MDQRRIREQLLHSLELKRLWIYCIITVSVCALFLFSAVSQDPEESWGIGFAILGVMMGPYLLFCTVRTVKIFRKLDQYAICKATLVTPHGGLLRDTIYFTALVTDPDTGEKFHADTHAVFFARGIIQPLMEDYINTTVTLAWNRETDMVVVIG